MKLLIRSPAPTSRTSESETSATTSALRARSLDFPAVALPPSLSVSRKSASEALRAGSSPKMTPVRTETITVKASTRPSKLTSPRRGMSAGLSATRRSVSQRASSSPSPPPRRESRTLSVMSWRMMRRRVAPSATRSANSRRRATERAKSRLATLAEATSRTKPTAPSSMKSAGRMLPKTSSSRDETLAPRSAFVSGCCSARRAAMASISACACASVTPGFRRATTVR